jgi:hypothetical protein
MQHLFASMFTQCKKPCITELRQQKVVLCVVGMVEYGACLILAALVFCCSLVQSALTSLRCVATLCYY